MESSGFASHGVSELIHQPGRTASRESAECRVDLYFDASAGVGVLKMSSRQCDVDLAHGVHIAIPQRLPLFASDVERVD